MSNRHYYVPAQAAILYATPVFIAATSAATRQNQNGNALTPDNTANGDLIIGQDGRLSATLPDLATGVTELIVGGTGIGTGGSIRLWYKFITAAEAIPAAGNIQRRVLGVFRNVNPTSPIISVNHSTTNTTLGTIPALTTFADGEEALVVAGYLHDNATATQTLGAPLVQRQVVAATNQPGVIADTDGLVTSFTAQTFTIATDAFIGWAVALRGAEL